MKYKQITLAKGNYQNNALQSQGWRGVSGIRPMPEAVPAQLQQKLAASC